MEGEVPDLWRMANVTALFKKGSKLQPSNYRPVSLTSVPCKALESLVREAIMDHCERAGVISKKQHGFVFKRACVTNLLESLDIMTQAMYDGFAVDVIYTDFAKAFDTVPHRRLLHKLRAYGIGGELLAWIEAWLKNRKQRVVLGEHTSEWKTVSSGVPQGSVLGPLLFVLFINDLPDDMNHNMKLYADDSKIIGVIKTAEDVENLQNDINAAHAWSQRWLMRFNISKCKVMHVGRDKVRSTAEYFMMNEQGNQQELEVTRVERDLGVMISDDLKLGHQVGEAAARANRVLGMFKKTFKSRGLSLWKSLYTTYIRPHLEFSIQAWSPYQAGDILTLERIQRRATKTITAIAKLPYTERLKRLKLTSLEERRERGDLIQLFKFSRGIDRIEWQNMPPPAPALNGMGPASNTRGHKERLERLAAPGCPQRHNFFTYRVVNPLNNLPQHALDATSVNSFKSRVDRHAADSR